MPTLDESTHDILRRTANDPGVTIGQFRRLALLSHFPLEALFFEDAAGQWHARVDKMDIVEHGVTGTGVLLPVIPTRTCSRSRHDRGGAIFSTPTELPQHFFVFSTDAHYDARESVFVFNQYYVGDRPYVGEQLADSNLTVQYGPTFATPRLPYTKNVQLFEVVDRKIAGKIKLTLPGDILRPRTLPFFERIFGWDGTGRSYYVAGDYVPVTSVHTHPNSRKTLPKPYNPSPLPSSPTSRNGARRRPAGTPMTPTGDTRAKKHALPPEFVVSLRRVMRSSTAYATPAVCLSGTLLLLRYSSLVPQTVWKWVAPWFKPNPTLKLAQTILDTPSGTMVDPVHDECATYTPAALRKRARARRFRSVRPTVGQALPYRVPGGDVHDDLGRVHVVVSHETRTYIREAPALVPACGASFTQGRAMVAVDAPRVVGYGEADDHGDSSRGGDNGRGALRLAGERVFARERRGDWGCDGVGRHGGRVSSRAEPLASLTATARFTHRHRSLHSSSVTLPPPHSAAADDV